MSRQDATNYTLDDVRAWLKDSGFRARGNLWIANEQSIGQVDPAEVLKIDEYNPPELE